MDLETARIFLAKRQAVDDELAELQPKSHWREDVFSPSTRFNDLVEVISNLPGFGRDSYKGQISFTFYGGLRKEMIKLNLVIDYSSINSQEVYEVMAQWVDQEDKRISTEALCIEDLNDDPETERILGLLEESVGEVQKILTPAKSA